MRPSSPPSPHRDLRLILAPNPGPMTLEGTNTYVVGRGPAHVIDPGPDDSAHLTAIRSEGETRGGIGGVLLTHSHADHSAGAGRLDAPLLWGSVAAADESHWSTELPEPSAERVPAGFQALRTPGHARDHTVFVWQDVCFCGDLILGEGSTIVPPAALGGSLGDYVRSLRRVRELGARLFAPGHGPWITDPQARVDEYLEHRAARERRLVAALKAGERSRTRLLAAVWDDVPETLRPAAAMAMQAHLEKLETEGAVALDELTE